MPSYSSIVPYAEDHACGHRIYQRIPTTQAQRDAAIAKSLEPCRDCKRAADQAAASEAANRDGMAPLEGSEKQVAWAMTLRQQALTGLSSYLVGMVKLEHPDLRFAMAATEALEYGVKSASFWIDHRRADSETLLAEWTPIARAILEGAPA